jgi:4-amino-4-deoxy-L-arabinose transferase-like glycosyltransferase
MSTEQENDRMTRGRTLVAVLGLYFLTNFIVRLCLPHGLELDEAEQTYLSQWLLAGYGSQPPFYNWMQYAAVHVFGMSLATLSALKNLLLFSSYLFYWLAARQVLTDKRLAIVAALGLVTIPQVAFEAQRDLSHTVAAIFGTSLFILALLRTLSVPSLLAFVLLGIATGIGAITKYNFAPVPVAVLLAMLADRDLRRRLLDWRLLISGAIAFVIVAPHALWLLDNVQAASSQTISKMVGDDAHPLLGILHGFRSLALALLGFSALTLAIFAAVYRGQLGTIVRAQSPWTRFFSRILMISVALIVLMIVFGGMEKVRDRWLTPILLVLPLYLCLKIDAARVSLQPGIRRMWICAGIIMALVPSVLFGRIAFDRMTDDYEYINVPFAALARQIETEMAGQPSLIVADGGQLAGNMRFNLPSTTVATPVPVTGTQPLSLRNFRRVVFVWGNADGSPPPAFEQIFSDYLQAQGIAPSRARPAVVSYPYAWGPPTDQYRFGIAVLDMAE